MLNKLLCSLFAMFLVGGVMASPLTITDMANRTVVLSGKPERLVALGPGTLRLLVYMQATAQVVAVEDMEKRHPTGRPYWLAQPKLSTLPRCGPGGPASINRRPDLETLLAISPDVIFVTMFDRSLADDVQRILSIPIVVLSYGELGNFDETVFRSLHLLGTILGRPGRARAIEGFVADVRRDLRDRISHIPLAERPRAYVGGIGHRGSHGIISTRVEYAPFDWLGVPNVVSDLPNAIGSHRMLDREELLALAPEVVFLDGGGLALIESDLKGHPAFYRRIPAFAKGRAFVLFPYNWYTTNIGTVIADTYAVGKSLFPPSFADVELPRRTNEIYEFFVGAPVYQGMEKTFGQLGRKGE